MNAALLKNALTEVLAPQTKESPVATKDWAKWLDLDADTADAMSDAIKAAARWAYAVKDGKHPRWLTLTGSSGTGKTHIATRLFRWAKDKIDTSRTEFHVTPIYWPRMVSDLKSGLFERSRDAARWPILMLDDVGAERDPSGFAMEQLNTILGQREGKWTLITSNLTLRQIAENEPRIADRIIRPPNIRDELTGPSYAKTKATRRKPFFA